jgi:DNA-binding NarL/FixJ family response regulator
MRDTRGEAAHEPVGVVVVDDQRLFRHAARDVIAAAHPDFVLLGEATSGEHALAAVDDLHPDLVLVDVRMAGMDGIETARRLKGTHPETVVVLVTTEEPLNLPAAVGFCGAADLVRKQDFGPSLLRRLWSAHGGAAQ